MSEGKKKTAIISIGSNLYNRLENCQKGIDTLAGLEDIAFVLQPLCDIDPDIVHPVLKKDMRCLLDNVNDKDQKVLPYPC